jgi:hypothetical protein
MTNCVIPGCLTPVDAAGETCDDCITAFGTWLRPTDTAPMTAEQIRDRDAYVERAYYAQRQSLRGAR